MLMAHPTVLRNLLERYESLNAQGQHGDTSPQLRRKIDDVCYTLCVSTGTRTIQEALASARARLAAASDSLHGAESALSAR